MSSGTFGWAIKQAQNGSKVTRSGWNGKGMFIVYMPPLALLPYNAQEPGQRVNDRTAKFVGKDTALNVLPYFALFTATREWLPGWPASHTDMLATDWEVVPDVS